jgi:hypothetical protein
VINVSRLKTLIDAGVFTLSEYETREDGMEYMVWSGWIRRKELIGWLETAGKALKRLQAIEEANKDE